MSELSEMSADEALSDEEMTVEALTLDELSMHELDLDELSMDELGMDELSMDELDMDELIVADADKLDFRAPFDFSLKVEVPLVRATDPSTRPMPASLVSLLDSAPSSVDQEAGEGEPGSTKSKRKGRFRRT